MFQQTMLALSALALVLAMPRSSPACSLCYGRQSPTFREEAAQPAARLILFGLAQNPRLNASGGGTTDFKVTAVLRSDPFLGERKLIELPRYLAVSDPKDPPKFLLFCDVFMNKLDPFRGTPIKSDDAIDYVKKAIALDPKDRIANLGFFSRYLEHPDKEIAKDAFLEFAKASDQEIGQVAGNLSPDKLRTWLKDAQTAPERLSLYAMLLGVCGGAQDATFLEGLLKNGGERYNNAYDGLLGGYIHLRSREGWELALSILRDGGKPLPVRLAVVRTLRFYHGWQPKESRANLLKAVEAMIVQGELADLAVEDLRKWQIWDLTREVLGLYGKKGYDSPILQRAIVRYALCCKDSNTTAAFLTERRRLEPDLVKEVEESLQYDKPK